MRSLLLALLLALVTLAGCLGDELTGDGSSDPCDGATGTMDDGDAMDGMEGVNTTDEEGNASTLRTMPILLLQAGNQTGNSTGNETGNQTEQPDTMDSMEATDDADCAEDDAAMDDGPTGPWAELVADVTEGVVPFDVFFTFDAGNLDLNYTTWTLNVAGIAGCAAQGEALPGNFTCTVTAAGTFNATFTADDGFVQPNATVAITATEPAAPGGDGNATEPSGPVEQSFEGSWYLDDPRCLDGPAGQADLTYAAMTVDQGTWGQKFFAKFTGGFAADHLYWLDAAGAVLLAQADTDSGEFYEIDGKVPTGAVTAHFFTCVTPAVNGLGTVDYMTPV